MVKMLEIWHDYKVEEETPERTDILRDNFLKV